MTTPQQLAIYVADTAVLYIKLHNLHWNVVGSDFKAVHEYLETLYDGLADVLDATAECLKMHGVQPPASMKDCLAISTIAELDSEERPIADVLPIVKQDMEILKNLAEGIRSTADTEELYDVVSLMEDHLLQYRKTLWFLSAMSK